MGGCPDLKVTQPKPSVSTRKGIASAIAIDLAEAPAPATLGVTRPGRARTRAGLVQGEGGRRPPMVRLALGSAKAFAA